MALQVGRVLKLIFLSLIIGLKLHAQVASSSSSSSAQSSSQVQSRTKKVSKKPKVSPWSGSIIADVTRATDINHSKILDPENPEQRRDYSLAFVGSISYKWDAKNTYSATEVITKDIIRNSPDEKANDFSLKNLRLGWTRATDYRIAGSEKIYLPFSIVLPTTQESRAMGVLGNFRFWPVLSWALNPKWTILYSSMNVFSFSHPTDQNYDLERVVQDGVLTSSNSLTVLAQITSHLSVSQNIGITILSQGLHKPLDMDQMGSSLNVTTGVSYMASHKITIDACVTQSSPLQGSGVGATKVYDDNKFRLYHVAQTSYGLTGTYLF